MDAKKQTNGQLQRRIANAIVLIDKTKDTKSVYFDDKGLRLTVNEDYAIIETGYHRHIFSNFTSAGVSKPWLYTQRLVDIALEHDAHSFSELTQKLKDEGNPDYNFLIFISWWLFNIFQPLYTIGSTDVETFLVYEDYMHNIAKNTIILSEKKESITNKQFMDSIQTTLKEFTSDIDEHVLFEQKTDEELMQENIAAINEMENEKVLNQQNENNESKD